MNATAIFVEVAESVSCFRLDTLCKSSIDKPRCIEQIHQVVSSTPSWFSYILI